MLQINKRPPLSGPESAKLAAPLFEAINFSIKIVRRQAPIVIVVMVCALALALLYLFTTPPMFTASGAMVIDTRKVQILQMGQQNQSVLGDIQIDASTVQTQVEVIKSENISLAVIRKLNLTKDPEFVGSGGGLISRIATFIFGAGPPPSEYEIEQAALGYFEGQRSVTREGLTYVINVGFTSRDPEKAAKIVNAIVAAYADDQLDAKYQAARRAGVWLMERVGELKGQAAAAERAVADFKEKNNIVSLDQTGKLMNEQQLGEVNSQLIIAKAATAEAKARLDRILTVMNQEIPDSSIADALKSEVIIKLRQQYLEMRQREAIFAQRYGANHLATINLRTQMQELRRSISDEMRKIAGSFKSDYEVALTKEASLKNSLANVVSDSQASGQAQVQLRELKSSADTARTLYDSFLTKYMETIQQQDSVPISETRLISPATPPQKKSSPKGFLTIVLALIGGGGLGFAIAYLREASDGVLRTSDQVEDILHVNCLAMAPKLKVIRPVSLIAGGTRFDGDGDDAEGDFDRPATYADHLSHVVSAPFSRYAEAVRSIKIAADLNGALKSHKVIGLTSTLPNEGKSTIASNLAHLIADAGGSVILLDADLRSPSLSRCFNPDAPGLIEAVIGNISLEAAITRLPGSKLDFLPAGATSKLPHTNEILASSSMKKLVDGLRAKYDYIIVDLSPVAPIVDVRTTGHIIDTYVYVVEWGKTKVDVIERGLSEAQSVYDRLLGVVLNKVDMEAQSRYERYHGNHYYRKYYSKYGYVE